MCDRVTEKGDTDSHAVVMPVCQPVTLLGFNWRIRLTVHRSTAELRSKINMQKNYQINKTTKTTHSCVIHHNMCDFQVNNLPTPYNTLRINTDFVLIHRLFCKCAFWGIQKGAGLQQCSAVQLRSMHGCYDFLPHQGRPFPTVLPALFGL